MENSTPLSVKFEEKKNATKILQVNTLLSVKFERKKNATTAWHLRVWSR